uniref:NR LBD domain-containing protein n=1 Tax=Ditylenchus dipsaci TaxID=166011 RepID=A0A915EBX7_9BILA
MTPKSPRLSHPIKSPIERTLSARSQIVVTPTLQQTPSVLEEIVQRYDEMNRRRKVFYSKSSLSSLFDDSVELEPYELTDFGECMYQFWRIEPKLAVEFIASNQYFKEISKDEKAKIFSNFLMTFHAIEEPYITWKHGGLTEGKEFWMMPNRVYMVFNHTEQYFDRNSSIMKDLNLDKSSAVNLFKPSFEHAMEVVGRKMADMNLTKTEMIALVGIVLFDSICPSLAPETKEILNNLKNQLFKDMINHYEADDSIDYPEIRLGNLILLMAGIKIHAQKSRENMHLLKIFDVLPRDELFDDVTGITPAHVSDLADSDTSSSSTANIID